jgi:hypothetical protein
MKPSRIATVFPLSNRILVMGAGVVGNERHNLSVHESPRIRKPHLFLGRHRCRVSPATPDDQTPCQARQCRYSNVTLRDFIVSWLALNACTPFPYRRYQRNISPY